MPRSLNRRALLALLGASAAAPFARAQSSGAFQPTRAVRILSPQQPGGSTDAVLRPLAQKLSELWGQPVLVDNRPGGGTLIATQAVVQAAPDGHTLGLAINALTINPSLRQDLPTTRCATSPRSRRSATPPSPSWCIPRWAWRHCRSSWRLAKAKPGALSWASLGIGTGGHITGELLCKRAGVQAVHVPFTGSSGAYRELLPGRVHAAFVVLESAVPHLQAGSLKLLAVSDRVRNPRFPDTPSLDESHPGLAYESLLGLFGPARMPAETVQQLHADVRTALRDPAVRQQLDQPVDRRDRLDAGEFAAGPAARDRALARRRPGIRRAAELSRHAAPPAPGARPVLHRGVRAARAAGAAPWAHAGDGPGGQLLVRHASRCGAHALMLLVSSVHQTGKLLAVSALLAVVLALHQGLAAGRPLLVVPLGMLVNLGLKDLFQRARPVFEDPLVQLATYSFPSGHAVASTVFYGALCVLVFAHTRSRAARAAACALGMAMVALVCFSRVYLGAHFPGDVLAGVAVGHAVPAAAVAQALGAAWAASAWPSFSLRRRITSTLANSWSTT
jgi:tripartite-type tricarboxylate transporter receptor subunit TctC/membrane-associated phospholipid phosphatase